MRYPNPFKQSLSGKEIKDWIWFYSNNITKHRKIAKTMQKYFSQLDDNKYYRCVMCDGVPRIKEVDERGVKDEIPCDNIAW